MFPRINGSRWETISTSQIGVLESSQWLGKKIVEGTGKSKLKKAWADALAEAI